MISKEIGNLPGSHYYFFTPSETAKKHYFYLIWCGHYFCKTGYSIHRNSFPYLLIAYIKKGIMNLKYDGERYAAKEGDILLIDCQYPHHYYSSDGLEFTYFHFDGVNSHAFFDYLYSENKSPIFQTPQNTELGRIMSETITRYKNEEIISEEECSKIIYHVICDLSIKEKINSTKTITIEKSIEYIKANLHRKISLDDIAKSVNLSTYYFSHFFKNHQGFSPMEYVKKCRMDTAISLLRTTQKSVGEIALDLGYSSDASFINAFTKKTGVSPNKLRNIQV